MRLLECCATCALVLAATWLRAEGLPNEIRILVPVTAGSSLDARARVIADAIGQRLDRRIIVENRSGAGGTIGALAVARSRPDGSTLLFTNNSHVVSPHVYANPGYDPIRDFAPVAQAYVSGMVLVAHPDLHVASLKELVALARRQPQAPSYASSGTGGLPHLATELFKQVAGIDLLHVPYRGDGQALTDVLAGRVPLMMSGYVVVLPHVRAGKLRALAVTTKERISMLPDVPTTAEAGLPEVEVSSTFGVLAPAATPKDIVDKLNAAVAKMVTQPDVKEQFLTQGVYAAPPTTSARSAERLAQEVTRWAKLIGDAGIKADE